MVVVEIKSETFREKDRPSSRSIAMSVRQQGAYLATTLAGFVALTAGLAARASYPGAGVVVALAGLVLLIVSAAGFHRVKGS